MSISSEAVPDAADVDIWWGSYWGWAMLPSWIVCGLVAAGLASLVWTALRFTGYEHLAAVTVVLVVGLIQLLRWAARFFGHNYRLTSRRLFLERGIFPQEVQPVELRLLARVGVEAVWWERRLWFGRVILYFKDDRLPAVVLEAVHEAEKVAEMIRTILLKAQRQ